MYCHVINGMSTNVSLVRAASIIRAMMEAAHTSETSVDIQLITWQYIPLSFSITIVPTLIKETYTAHIFD
jgi:predicted class III extradiol MEMO1 family dioxygenase